MSSTAGRKDADTVRATLTTRQGEAIPTYTRSLRDSAHIAQICRRTTPRRHEIAVFQSTTGLPGRYIVHIWDNAIDHLANRLVLRDRIQKAAPI